MSTDDDSSKRKSEEGRVSAFVSPEAKQMLQELGRMWFPNLKRPMGSVLDRIIREAYQRQFPATHETFNPRGREQEIRKRTQIEPRDPRGPESGL